MLELRLTSCFILHSSYVINRLWAEKCAKMNGHFPYPLLEIMNATQRFAFYGAVSVFVGVVGLLVTKLQARITDSAQGQAGSRSTNKKRL